jgi:transcriptional regulator with XRE-family HTH domain
MTGYHTRWVRPPEHADDPERIASREALAFGKTVYDQRCALGLTVTDLAARADMTVDDVECIEEGGTEPTIALLRRLAAALDSDVRLTPRHDLGSLWFEPHAADSERTPTVQRRTGRHSTWRLISPRNSPATTSLASSTGTSFRHRYGS